jgi:hypothetical protein
MKKLDLSRSGDSKIMTKAEWDYDGDGTYEVADTGPWPTFSRGDIRWVSFQGNLKFSSPGNRTVNLKITHADGSVDTNSGTFTAVADVPTARIVSPVSIAFTGAATELSASGTTTLGGISNYDWDTNGDGSYETSGGVTKSISWDTVGSKSVGVRVTSRDGHTSTASVVVEVRKTTPGSRPSISINSGNPYTNSKEVSLGIVWPAYATTMDISNDGGFPSSQTQTVAVGENISWALDDSIYGLYTKVVYVRFNGSGVDVNKVYSDDVVLDTTAPKLSSASSAKGSGAVDASMVSGISSFVNSDIRLAKKAKSTTKVVRIKTKAKDERSGLGKVQVALSASGNSAVTVPYKTQIKVTVPKSAKKVWVRVADGAGNWSKWKVLKAK